MSESLIQQAARQQAADQEAPKPMLPQAMPNEDGSLIKEGNKEGGFFVPKVREITPPTPATPMAPPAQTPTNTAPQKPNHASTPMFGPSASGTSPPAAGPVPSAQPSITPQQPIITPQEPAAPHQQAPQTSQHYAFGYITESQQGDGLYALVLDSLNQRDMDYISFIAEYIKAKYPGSMPVAHPAAVAKFAINHLLIDIRKLESTTVQCGACNTVFDKSSINCPKCGGHNRCPTCHTLIGNNNIYI